MFLKRIHFLSVSLNINLQFIASIDYCTNLSRMLDQNDQRDFWVTENLFAFSAFFLCLFVSM